MKRKRPDDLRMPEWLHLVRGGAAGASKAQLSDSDRLLMAMLVATYDEAFKELNDEDEAEEIAAEVMLVLLQKLAADPSLIERRVELEGMRQRRTRSRLSNRRRGGKRAERRVARLVNHVELEHTDSDRADLLVDDTEYSAALDRALAGLLPEYQDACVLRHALGMPPRDIAVRLGITLAVVKNRISRGMKQLREEMLPLENNKGMEKQS